MNPGRERGFSLSPNFRSSRAAIPFSFLMETGLVSVVPGSDVDHSPSSTAVVDNEWSHNSTPPLFFPYNLCNNMLRYTVTLHVPVCLLMAK